MMHISALFVLASAEQVHGRRSMAFVGHCALPGAVQAPAKNDGQDGTVAGQAPHTQVFRDGYWSVGCRFDAMQTEGDKYGNEADMYDLGRSANTSVVRYDEILDKENQKPMTPRVCFDFCRTVPEMQFFGLIHGRDCYCMHYYRNAAGGSGVCDLPCDGDSAKTCGGEGKSSIYQMHACEGGLEQDMQDTMADAETVLDAVGKALTVTTDVATAMQASGDALESLAEATASPLAQEAKVVAGPLTRAAEDLAELEAEGHSAMEAAATNGDLDTADFETRKKVEEAMAHAEELMDAADEAVPAAKEWVAKTQPELELGEDFTNTFVPILRQVDPAIERQMSVCEGDLTGTPIVGLNYDECTQACDDHAPKSDPEHCISVQYFDLPGQEPLCFLFKKLTELTVFNCVYEGNGGQEGSEEHFCDSHGPKDFPCCAHESREEQDSCLGEEGIAGDGAAKEEEGPKMRFTAGAAGRAAIGKNADVPDTRGFLQAAKPRRHAVTRHHKKHKHGDKTHKTEQVVRTHRPAARAHRKGKGKPARTPERTFFAHPAAQFVLEEKFHFRHLTSKSDAPGTFCAIRYASTYGVTPSFFDGITKLNRCFGKE